jgi:hypothetical protein
MSRWSGERPRKANGAAQAPDIHRTMPHSVEAEQGVLGSILQSPREAISECVAKISVEHFYVPAHRTTYQALLDQWDAGAAIDLITFTQVLRDKNLLDSVGGPAFVTNLFTFVPTAANVRYYLEIVADKFVLRQAVAAGIELVRRAYEELDNPTAVLDEHESKLTSIRSVHGQDGLFQDAAEALSKPIVTPPDVIEGVVHQGGKLVLGGASKSYKTWLLGDLAVSVTTGSMWLNYNTIKGRVLYVNCELPEPFFWKRVRAITDERQLKIEAGMLLALHLRGRITEWQRWQRQIPSGKYSLIILDPIYKLLLLRGFVRNENDPGPIAVLLDQMETLAVRTKAAVAFGAHYSKGDQSQKESIDRISGSGVWARDPDSILNFTKHEESDCFTVEMTLRNHPPREPFVVKWEYPLFVTESTLDPTRLKQSGRKIDEEISADEMLNLLAEPMRTGPWQKLAYEERNVSRATFYRRKKELQMADKIRQVKDRKWARVSE